MLNVYNEIEKLKKMPANDPHPSSLIPIKKSEFRQAKFTYHRDISQKAIAIENIIIMLNKLWMYKNVSSAFLNELLQFLQKNTDGYKYFQKTYFFVAHRKIYIIQAPENFRKQTINKTKKIWKNTYRYPQPTDRYKGKTRNQYCITQKIPLFRRNFTPVLETDNKITKVETSII